MTTDQHAPDTDWRVVPALRITDYAASRAFYVDGLGFRIDWEHRFEPHFPVFLQVSRDGLTFYLSQHTGDCQPGGLLHLYVPDVDRWYAEMLARGIRPQSPPEDQPWGRDFRVTDPDGNQLAICTPRRE
jgi:catechol 2,3-dioxygenase-like lactoylglutathione lyase family enzyme